MTLTEILPWVLSSLTIYSSILQGNLNRNVWLINIGIQGLWLVWILVSHNHGFLPLTIALTVIYIRNHFKWNKT